MKPALVALFVLGLFAPIAGCDHALQQEVQSGRVPWLEPVMKGASSLGRPQNVFAILLGVAVLGGPGGPVIVREVIAVLLPTNAIVEGMKFGIGRVRPDGDRKRSNSSMPSSHAANAFALAAWVGWRWRRALFPALAAASLVAASRVYLNRHFVSDVLVGAAIGVACLWLAAHWFRGGGRVWVERGRLRSRSDVA